MNRRDFMGTVVGGIAVAKLGTAGLVGYGADSAVVHTADASAGAGRQGAWIENGLIDAGGTTSHTSSSCVGAVRGSMLARLRI